MKPPTTFRLVTALVLCAFWPSFSSLAADSAAASDTNDTPKKGAAPSHKVVLASLKISESDSESGGGSGAIVQTFSLKAAGTLNLTGFPAIDSTVTLSLLLPGTTPPLTLAINLSQDPNITSDLQRGTVVIADAPFSSNSLLDQVKFKSQYKTGSPTAIYALKFSKSKDGKPEKLQFSVVTYGRAILGAEKVTQGVFGYGAGKLGVLKARENLADTRQANDNFGDTTEITLRSISSIKSEIAQKVAVKGKEMGTVKNAADKFLAKYILTGNGIDFVASF
ncbi:MAG TPA: hypothetical protein VKX17_04010 [Planctomycetota bacterium]|nr:hypothetical protein [Planctomycetota bacterium]